MPHDPVAEASVLGSALLDPRTVPIARGIVKPADFFDPVHALTWEAVCAVHDAGVDVSAVTVAARLRADGRLETVGYSRLLALTDDVVTTAFLEPHARVVATLAAGRRAGAAARVVARMSDDGADLGRIAAAARACLAATELSGQRGPESSADIAARLVDRLDAPPEQTRGAFVGFGLETLDRMTGGMGPGELFVVGGVPGAGKSALVARALRLAAQRTRGHALCLSLEMPTEQYLLRLACERAGVDSMELRRGTATAEDRAALAGALAELSALPMLLDAETGLTLEGIRAKVLRQAGVTPLSLVALDYLQLVRVSESRSRSHAQALGDVANGLKALAKDAGCPLLCISSLNRIENGKRPTMGDFRGSGEIEFAADVILSLVTDEKTATEHTVAVDIDILKQRHGEAGKHARARVRFIRAHTSFVDDDPDGYIPSEPVPSIH